MEQYDEPALVRALDGVAHELQVAFAAACAERLIPAYAAYCRESGRADNSELERVLASIWGHILGDEMEPDQMRECLTRCMNLIPDEDQQPWTDLQPYAEDAAAAVAYALRSLSHGAPQEAAWAARRAYEAVDHYASFRLGASTDEEALAHQVVQVELGRQRRDMDEVLGADAEYAPVIARLRDRAKVEGASRMW